VNARKHPVFVLIQHLSKTGAKVFFSQRAICEVIRKGPFRAHPRTSQANYRTDSTRCKWIFIYFF